MHHSEDSIRLLMKAVVAQLVTYEEANEEAACETDREAGHANERVAFLPPQAADGYGRVVLQHVPVIRFEGLRPGSFALHAGPACSQP